MVSLKVKIWLHGSEEIRFRLFPDKTIFEIFGNNSEMATTVNLVKFRDLHRLNLARLIIPEDFKLLRSETEAKIISKKKVISFRLVSQVFSDFVIQRSLTSPKKIRFERTHKMIVCISCFDHRLRGELRPI